MMRRRIMALTFTRAEYGLLKPIIRKIRESSGLELVLVVAGDHLNPDKGRTVTEIGDDGFEICEVVSQRSCEGGEDNIAETVANDIVQLSGLISRYEPQLVLVVGDRYELLAPATCAAIHRIPVAHVSGGESTEGVLDEQVRHAVTKISHLHFPSTWRYGWNIRRMGEENWRIHVVGAPGVENIYNGDFMAEDEIKSIFGIDTDRPIILVTFHPETLLRESPTCQVNELVSALRSFPDYQQIITYPGAEFGSQSIINAWTDYADTNRNVKIYPSLGSRGYLGVMRIAKAVVGNSSSGIVEAPSFHVPTVNIGVRQKGRIRADSVLDTDATAMGILIALRRALCDPAVAHGLGRVVNPYDPYGDGNVSGRVVSVLESIPLGRRLMEKRLDFPAPEEEEKFNV